MSASRINPLRFIESFLIFIFFVSLTGTAFLIGPPIEQRLFPVLDAKFVQIEETNDNRLKFYIEGTKLRSCQLEQAAFAWKFDHTIMPAGVADENGLPRPAAPIVINDQHFIAGPFYALVPNSARLANELRLTRSYYYRCHFLWTTEFDMEAPLMLIPTPAPDKAPQSPTVRILPK